MAVPGRLSHLAKSLGYIYVKSPSNGVRCFASLAQRGIQSANPMTSKLEELQTANQVICAPSLPQICTARASSFFTKLPADRLWKGVTGVSNAGKKQGRGKGVGRKRAKNLNRGQMIGVGRENMVWPGLNAPILRGRELIQRQKLPRDEEREANLIKLRDGMSSFRALRISPFERGWSGNRMPGRSIGPPDPIGEDSFDGFDTKVLELKVVTCMTAVFGRKRRMSIFAVSGNGNGLAGFALAKATAVQDAIRRVKNKAGQKLVYVERYDEHTVLHDFFTQYGRTKIFVRKMPAGYGLACHRAIRTICEVIGIKDIHAKVEGSTNVQNLTKAFFLGLINQKTHQKLADEKGLHLVEFRKENLDFPKVVASPQAGAVRRPEEIPNEEELDFTRYVMGGKLRLQKKKYPPAYEKLPSYNIYLKKFAKNRIKPKVIENMLVNHGEIRSFYADKYPECKGGLIRKKEEEQP